MSRAARGEAASGGAGAAGPALPAAAPAWRRVRAQAGMELRLLARNGESLLVTLGIPLALLAFFTLVDVLPTGGVAPVAFLLPRMLAVAVMGSGLVALAIHTGFEREYLVLKRLGATPLRRRDLVAAKALALAAIVAVQFAVLLAAGAALGWPEGPVPGPAPLAGRAAVALALLVLGAAASAGLGLFVAGTLRATATLAVTNALFVALLLGSGLLFPLETLPGAWQAIAVVLPSAALADLLATALAGAAPSGASAAVLLAWALAAPALAAWRFRWW